ncbi:MAG: radical SAM protein [Candidatus Bathyarchaeota archaeon]|nr:radical SAM protein [Candidatus Bathyarchaeota archaeon]
MESFLENFTNQDLEKFLLISRKISWRNFGKKIRFYNPSFVDYKTSKVNSHPFSFPSISITGRNCTLNCKHCNGKILNTMIPAKTPKDLINVCKDLKLKGSLGCLISGGSLSDGSLPLEDFTDAIVKIKKEIGLKLVVHTGLSNNSIVEKLKAAGIDAALIDIIGSNETIKEVCKLEKTVDDYDRSMKILSENQVTFVPHLIVGLHYGKLRGEFESVRIISKYNPASIVVIAFMPIKGTEMERIKPPAPEDIAKIIAFARIKNPKVPIVLGCVRPLGEHRKKTDELAIKAGVNGMAYPSEEAVDLVESMGLEINFSFICCSQIYEEYETEQKNNLSNLQRRL